MISLKNSDHIPDSRTIKGFRSCPPATGISLILLDRGRISFEKERLTWRKAHQKWMLQQCKNT